MLILYLWRSLINGDRSLTLQNALSALGHKTAVRCPNGEKFPMADASDEGRGRHEIFDVTGSSPLALVASQAGF